MSRAPMPYSQKILELFRNPKNLGRMDDATVSAVAGNPACGDMITFYLKVTEDEVIEKATFESYGCAANIATSSMLTEKVKGMKLEDAWKISWKNLVDEVGGLPTVKFHCGVLAIGALRRAIRAYYKDRQAAPEWLPGELTFEEKQALEEEELAKVLSKRMKTTEDGV
ncbi:MAG: iron-sulfur cluster assembly scaffold protein [Candidatus Bathyarchaeota archaeon]|nr:iron-sulfur cluster assembly scaffold protein [Candidatus Bathyarchaeota archaeon]MCX8177518.1 iron-sulfur cluster assembly scaffold protein [Candidatus Bathyarchaeota archaeon]MDW8194544.1 iron-sulfur cluster assembly scaffold protein [Nitrososphaerota archaeon]